MIPKPTEGEQVRTDWWEASGLTAEHILKRTALEVGARIRQRSVKATIRNIIGPAIFCSGPAGAYRKGSRA